MPSIDLGVVRFAWDVLQTLVVVCVAFYTWWQGRERASRKALSDLEVRVNEIDRKLDGRPAFSHFDDLRDELAQNNRQLAEVSARLEATTKLLDRLHGFLLDRGAPK